MSGLNVDVLMQRGKFRMDFRLMIPATGITALLGPSGSGKSTVLRAIAGLERPVGGHIAHAEETWFDAAERVCLPPQKRHVGMVFQDYALFDDKTVAKNVAYGLPKARREERVSEWLERLHLSPYAERYPKQLSGGQRQRVALARALATEPEILLLDEPFSAVDVTLRQHLRRQLQEAVANVNRPVVMVTHDLDDVRYLADYVGVLANGELQRFGPIAEVFADPASRAAAEVLGWQNFLPVHSITGTRVGGPWGAVELDVEPSPNADWLGIRSEHLRIATPEQEGIEAQVLRISELGAVREVECQSDNGTRFYLQRPWDEPLPVSGTRVRLHLPRRYLIPLEETCSAPVIGTATDASQSLVTGKAVGVTA